MRALARHTCPFPYLYANLGALSFLHTSVENHVVIPAFDFEGFFDPRY